MVADKEQGVPRPAKGSVGRRPERGWERVTAENHQDSQVRDTFRIDAPSPSQEVLAKHDADLDVEPAPDDQSTVTCF